MNKINLYKKLNNTKHIFTTYIKKKKKKKIITD